MFVTLIFLILSAFALCPCPGTAHSQTRNGRTARLDVYDTRKGRGIEEDEESDIDDAYNLA